MTTKPLIMAGLALVFGTTSYFAGSAYMKDQPRSDAVITHSASEKPVRNQDRQNASASVVVAANALEYGAVLTKQDLKTIPWPKDALPAGAHHDVASLLKNGERKLVEPIGVNEPVTEAKLAQEKDGKNVTSVRNKNNLSAAISAGMRAVTIPVDPIAGVGGFVQPGDYVDVIYLQDGGTKSAANAAILLENIKVLSVDQRARRSSRIAPGKTITLETDTGDAKKLALGVRTGKLSLILRGIGDAAGFESNEISPIVTSGIPSSSDVVKADVKFQMKTINVVAPGMRSQMEVPKHK